MTSADRIDWAQAHERLRLASAELAAPRSPAEAQRLLARRARTLALPLPEEAAPSAEPLELLAFRLAGERYAIPARHVLEVMPFRAPTRLPCTLRFVLGVVSHRGRVLPVIDLGTLLGAGGERREEHREIVAVEAAARTFGIAAEHVEGITRCAVDALAPPKPGDGHGFLRRATGELLAVLDLEALAADGRLDVRDDADMDHVSQGRELS